MNQMITNQQIAEANRLYYKKNASMYEATETCLISSDEQQMLIKDISSVMGMLSAGNAVGFEPNVLDACGGSGNVTLKLSHYNVKVTLCDISQELLEKFTEKSLDLKRQPTIICDDILNHLSSHPVAYDLIVFSSALHHIMDVSTLLEKAAASLKPGGYIYTIFDPVDRRQVSSLARIVQFCDYLVFKLWHQSEDIPAAVKRKIARIILGSPRRRTNTQNDIFSEQNLGVFAEYHARAGINDLELRQFLECIGLNIVWHRRYASARSRPLKQILHRLHIPTAFSFLVQKPGAFR